MFDVGWGELLVIAIVLIVVVGPKDLPRMLRAFGKTTAKMRSMASEFRTQFDEAMKEADLDEVRQTIADVQKLNPTKSLRDAMNPLRQIGDEIRTSLDDAVKPGSITEMPEQDAEILSAIEESAPAPATPDPVNGNGAAAPRAKTARGKKPAAARATKRKTTARATAKPSAEAAPAKTPEKTPRKSRAKTAEAVAEVKGTTATKARAAKPATGADKAPAAKKASPARRAPARPAGKAAAKTAKPKTPATKGRPRVPSMKATVAEAQAAPETRLNGSGSTDNR